VALKVEFTGMKEQLLDADLGKGVMARKRVILRLDPHALKDYEGQVTATGRWAGRDILAQETFIFSNKVVRDWGALGPDKEEPAEADLFKELWRWRAILLPLKLALKGIRNLFDFNGFFNCPEGFTAAVCVIEASGETGAVLKLAYDGLATVSINGEKLYQADKYHSLLFSKPAVFHCGLKQGENLVLVRLSQLSRPYSGFTLSLESVDKAGLAFRSRLPRALEFGLARILWKRLKRMGASWKKA
jgi:hypothetical protein